MAATAEFNDKIDVWVQKILGDPRNLATDIELREQSKVCIELIY